MKLITGVSTSISPESLAIMSAMQFFTVSQTGSIALFHISSNTSFTAVNIGYKKEFHKVCKISIRLLIISFTFFLNSSLLLYRSINAAVTRAIIPITAKIGPVSPDTIVPIIPACSAVPNNANLNFANNPRAVLIGPAKAPIKTRSGPTAAIIPPTITIVCLISGFRFLNHSVKSFKISAKDSNTGPRAL